MRNNVLDLVRINLKQSLDFRSLKNNKAKSGTLIGFIVLMGLLFLLISTFYSIMFGMVLVEAKMSFMTSALMMSAIATILVLTTSIMMIKAIFVAKDFEMLSAMPIKNSEIITAKIINLYIIEALYAGIIMLPNMIVNTVLAKDATFILVGILLLIGVEAFPMLIAALVGSVFAIISARFKYSNVIVIMLSLIAVTGIFSLSFMFSADNTDNAEIAGALAMISNNVAFINPTSYLIKLALENPIYYILYVIICLALYVGIIAYITMLFNRVHALSRVHIGSNKYSLNDLKQDSELKSLLNIEFKRLFASKMYFLNTAIGCVVGIVITIIFCISLNEHKAELIDLNVLGYVTAVLPLAAALFGTLGVASASSISMEGKSFWLSKTLPINTRNLLNSKIIASLSILGMSNVISSLIMSIFLGVDIYSFFIIILLPLSYSVFMSVLGLRLNLAMPKLHWNDEKEVVKQGGAAAVLCLIDFLATAILIGATIGLLMVNYYLATIIPMVLLLLASALIYLLMMKKSDALLGRIE